MQTIKKALISSFLILNHEINTVAYEKQIKVLKYTKILIKIKSFKQLLINNYYVNPFRYSLNIHLYIFMSSISKH